MARKRYITTDISLSGKVEELARKAGEYAVILWTWMIPHLDDWGRMEGEADKVFFAVTPRFALLGKTPDDTEKALRAMAELELIQRYEVNGQLFIQVNTDTFYELQTYIPKIKRKEDKSAYPAPLAESQQVAQNSTECDSALLSVPSPFTLLPSPSPSKNIPSTPAPENEGHKPVIQPKKQTARNSYSPEFEQFWAEYPKKVEKQKAFRLWKTRRKEGLTTEDLVNAAKNYAIFCRKQGTEHKFIKYPTTFLGPDKPFQDWIKTGEGDNCATNPTGNIRAAQNRRGLEHYRESFKDW